MSSVCFYLLLMIFLLPQIKTSPLNEYISHYEPLHYDTSQVHEAHLRAKRSVTRDHVVHLTFQAHNHEFRLRLKRDLSVFSDSFEVHGPQGRMDVDLSHIYQGDLLGESGSSAFGSIIDGVFEGKIVTSKGTYYVEKSGHYLSREQFSISPSHSVIYHEDHVKHRSLEDGSSGCGIDENVVQWMNSVQNSAAEEEESPSLFLTHSNSKKGNKYLKQQSEQSELPLNDIDSTFVYSEEPNVRHLIRSKRNRKTTSWRRERKNTCALYIQTDPLIWRHVRERFSKHADLRKENEINERSKEEILSLIAQHVAAVNYLYGGTKFDGRREHRDIKFEVQRIKIDDDTSSCRCTHHHCGERNQFCLDNIDARNFLNVHSLGNHEDFCLAYVFTYRDFTGGTLGLAWQASATGVSGGICEKYKTYTDATGGTFQSIKRSLNTGVITLLNYNTTVPPIVSQLTFAHQIGHNFGSPHDYPPECRPGGANGNFIMFSSATSGSRPNNGRFSTCSLGNISNVLDAMDDNQKRNCFTASAGAFCGNKIVEAGEECDCGFDDVECTDKCCYPRILSAYDSMQNASARGCKRRHGTECSPSEGPCCNSDNCKFVPAYELKVCRSESECQMSSKCNGRVAECPDFQPKPQKTRCNNGTQMCINGECIGSICLEWNLQECSINSQEHPNRKMCEVACRNGSESCKSTSEFAEKVGLPPGGINLRPGSPCNNFQGYCDASLKCRAVDTDTPLTKRTTTTADEPAAASGINFAEPIREEC